MEVVEFVFSTVLLSTMFAIAYQWNLTLGLLLGASGLMLHELGHKLVGRWRCIRDVHFTMSPIGIALGFATSILFGQALAAPGGVTVGDDSSQRDRLWMGLAGPATNILVFFVAIGLHEFAPLVVDFGSVISASTITSVNVWLAVAFVNLYLGFFNLLPIPMFDGSHIYSYNKWVWFASILVCLVLISLFLDQMADVLGPLFSSYSGVLGSALGDLQQMMAPLFPGFMLMHSKELNMKSIVAHSPVDSEFEELW